MVCILFRYSTWNSNFDSIHWKKISIEMKMNTFNWNQMFGRFWMLQLQAVLCLYSIMHLYNIWLSIWIWMVWFMSFWIIGLCLVRVLVSILMFTSIWRLILIRFLTLIQNLHFKWVKRRTSRKMPPFLCRSIVIVCKNFAALAIWSTNSCTTYVLQIKCMLDATPFKKGELNVVLNFNA